MGQGKNKISGSIQEKYNRISEKQLPLTFKVARPLLIKSNELSGGLFDKLEQTGGGQYTIGGLPRMVSDKDFFGGVFALAQILSNQSALSSHEKENSGLNSGLLSSAIKKQTGESVPVGNVYFSLNEFSSLANGVEEPSTLERKASETLLQTLHRTPLVIDYKDKKVEISLATIVQKVTDKDKRGAVYYNLYLHPLFVDIISKGFAQYPQDIMKRLRTGIQLEGGKLTGLPLKLLALLGQQRADGNKTFTRTALEILQYLGLEQAYRLQKKRTLKQLEQILEAVKYTGIITKYEMKYRQDNCREVFDRVVFYLNANFLREEANSSALK